MKLLRTAYENQTKGGEWIEGYKTRNESDQRTLGREPVALIGVRWH